MGVEDRRQHPRIDCRYPAFVFGPRGPIHGLCTNLSVGGLFLEGVVLPFDPEVAIISVEFPTGRITFQAQVRRVSDHPRGIGFQFLRLEPAHLEVLHRYASK